MKNRTIKLLFFALLASVSLSSCLKDDDSVNDFPMAGLMMVNAYNAAEAVVYVADNNTIQHPSNPLLYKEHSFVGNLLAGQRRLRILSSFSENAPIVDTIYTFKDSTFYTSFVFGNDEAVMHLITEDKPLADLGDESGLRFFHLASNTGNVDVYLGTAATPLFSDRSLDEEVDETDHAVFLAHISGTQQITIKDDQGGVLVDREFDFVEGEHYSIVLIGDKDSSETPLYLGVVKQ